MSIDQAVRRSLYRVHQVYKRFAAPITLGCRAIVVQDDKVLLVRHSYKEGWYLPGGAVDRKESLPQAIARELLEECHIEVREPELVAMYFSELEGRSDHVALYLVKNFIKIAGRRHDPEIAAREFFPLAQLPQECSPATKRRLNEFKSGSPKPERW